MGQFADDEDAVRTAVDTMFSMCGNAGQEAILFEGLDTFEEFGLAALEEEGADTMFEDLVGRLYEAFGFRWDKFDATDIIWEYGYEIVTKNFGVHDTFDEHGEGTGA